MNILVYEDERAKSGNVTDLIEKEYPFYEINVETSLKDAKDKIRKNKYDLVIADLETPISRSDEEVEKNSGIIFLEYIYQSEGEKFYRPDEVVVLTQYAEDLELLLLVKKFPVSVLKYEERGEEWKVDLINRIYDCGRKFENKVDIAIITAVEVEFNAFFSRGQKWDPKEIEGDVNLYYIREYENKAGKKLKVLLTSLPKMGMVPTADITHRIINQFEPYCIIMSGICGGNKGEVKIGDIVIAEKAWDYGSGSMKPKEDGSGEILFEPAPDQISADQMIIREFRKYSLDDSIVAYIQKQCDTSKFDRSIKIKIGGMATGAAVIKNEAFVDKYIATSHRKYLGIDMETYGLYYAAKNFVDRKVKYLSIKSVSDGADLNKSNEFQEYCAKLAANLTNYFIENVTYDMLIK